MTQERIRQNVEKAEKFNYGKVLKATVHNRPLIGVMVATLGSMLFITGSNQVRSYIFNEKAEKFNYGKVLKATVHNRPLIGVMVATLGSMLFITGSNQVRSYIFKEYYARTDVMSIISLATIPILVICFPLVPKLVAKFGKKATLMAAIISSTIFSVIPVVMEIKNVYVYSALVVLGTIGQTVFTMLIWALVTDCLDYSEWKFVIPVVMEIKNVYVYSALVVLGTIGQTVFTMLIWALVTDCLDYSEWKFHERSDGSMYSLYTFSRKIGSTIASTGVSFGLAAIGFVSGSNVVQTAEAVNGIYFLVNIIPVVTCALELIGVTGVSFGLAAIGFVSGSNVVQTAEAVNGIYFLVNIIPVVTCALELIGVGLIFNLNKETTEQMYAQLKAK